VNGILNFEFEIGNIKKTESRILFFVFINWNFLKIENWKLKIKKILINFL